MLTVHLPIICYGSPVRCTVHLQLDMRRITDILSLGLYTRFTARRQASILSGWTAQRSQQQIISRRMAPLRQPRRILRLRASLCDAPPLRMLSRCCP